MTEAESLESLWERLAEAITAAGPEREALFLAKLALLLGREIGDPSRIEALIATALRDLD
jgi:hypothetical protein